MIKNGAAGDNHTETVHKIKLWDRPRALELLAKHFKLLTDVVQVEHSEALLAALDRVKQRNAARGLLREESRTRLTANGR